jgi:hypothetical protein
MRFNVQLADWGEGRQTDPRHPWSHFALCPPLARCYCRRVRHLHRLLLAGAFVAGLAPAAVAGDTANGAAAESVQAMQQRILADPEMSSAVQALRDDPAVQAILNDPEITKALARGDMAALLNDPKVRDLADDPAVQGLTRKMGR